jgi:hypothetical protein
MRWIAVLIGSAVLAGSPASDGQAKPDAKPGTSSAVTVSLPRSLLPDSFAGWVADAKPKPLSDAATADSANAAALNEYGFQNGVEIIYKRDDEMLTVRALRFGDLSGAYGAYSFYRGNGWPKEDIGNGAASNRNRVIFWQGSTVIDATFSRVSPMSGSELRELATQLPAAQGAKALAPPVLGDLPQKWLDGQTTHYAMGPAGYAGSGGVLPPDLVGFDRGAEVVTASYSLTSGPAVLTLIDYPTPQLAIARENKIREYIKAGSKAQPAFSKPLTDSDQASLEVRRSGPVVALVSGDAIPDESHKLIGSVHYESEFVSIPQPGESEVSKTGKLLLGIAQLVIIGSVTALLLGFFLGGGRALYRKARGKPASSVFDAEFIRLDLRE